MDECGVPMAPPLDIFAVRNTQPEWVGCANTLAWALVLACETGTGSYFVFSEKTEHKFFFEVVSDGVVCPVPAPKPQ